MSVDNIPSNTNDWRIAPGDPTCVFAPGVAKPIKCGSQKAAALIVAAVNAYCLACKGSGWIDGAPGERIPCDCRPAPETESSQLVYGPSEPLSDEGLRVLWRAHGGDFHGPNVETGTMPESRLLPFLRSYITARRIESFGDSVRKPAQKAGGLQGGSDPG